MNIFFEISVLLAITTAVTLVVRLLKQPLVVGYILSGIIVGPYFLNVLNAQHELEFFSKVGIVFLLFIVGLHLNPKVIKEVGSVSVVAGIGQIVLTTLVGFVITLALGLDRIAALYISIALTFSSTIVILKLLADKKDLQKLYAKITMGLLIIQDIVATLILIGITVTSHPGDATVGEVVILTLLKGAGIFVVLGLLSAFVLPRLTRFIAHSQELLFLFSLAWGTGLASLFAALGFSVEIGALVAGVSLSVTPFADEMAARLKPLRDFFIVLFFILLGSQVVIADLGQILFPALVLSLFVLVGNPIIMIILMNMLGYNRKTGYMAGLTVAQVSEFSLILAALGMEIGHLSQATLSLVTLVALITIAGSTYLILYSEKLYPHMKQILIGLELLKRKRKDKGSVSENYECVIFGYGRIGHQFTKAFTSIEKSFIVVDFSPTSVERLTKNNIPFAYGDASDVEFLEDLPLTKPEFVVSTIPDITTNLLVTKDMLRRNPKALVVPMAHTINEAKQLYEAGAAYVMMPHYIAADHITKLIQRYELDRESYQQEREKHQKVLETHSL